MQMIQNESFEKYQQNWPNYLNYSRLKDFKKSPLLFFEKHIAESIISEDKPAYEIGRQAHTLILEGAAVFDSQYMVADGPINEKTGKPFGTETKAYASWRMEQDKPTVASATYAQLRRLREGVLYNQAASDLLTDGAPEVVFRGDYAGHNVQARVDYITDDYIVDLKTCQDLDLFERDARKFGYLNQLAFYCACAGGWRKCYIIAVEKAEPYRAGVWEIPPFAIEEARRENEAALGRLTECYMSDKWPTGYEDVRMMA